MPELCQGGWGFRSRVSPSGGEQLLGSQTQLQAPWGAADLDVHRVQSLVRAGGRAAFLRYLKIDLVRLAALLFLVQVQDPHVGSSAAGEEQGARKAGNVILALLPACARLQARNHPA